MTESLHLFVRTNRRHLAEMLLASVLINLLLLALPLFTSLVYDRAMGNQVHDTLWALAIGMGLLLGLELLLRVARVHFVEHAGARWDAFLDERLMRGVLSAPLSRPLPAAEVLGRTREVGATRDVLSAQSLLAMADLPFIVLFAAVIFLMAGPLVLVPLVLGAGVVLAGHVTHRLADSRQRESNRVAQGKLTLLVDVLSARESLAGRAAAEPVLADYRAQAQSGARTAARARLWLQLNQQLSPVAMTGCSVLVLVLGVLQVEAQALSVGGLISANLLASRLLGMLCTVAPLRSRWRDFRRSLKALADTVDLATPPLSGAEPRPAVLTAEGVRLDKVSFRWPDRDRDVLTELSLDLQAGQLVALVGASGCGKSTLLRLLAGHLAPTSGRLAFGGHVVDSAEQRLWLGRQALLKSQDPVFLGGRLAQVLSAGAQRSDEELLSALRRAGLGPQLQRGDLGLNTQVGTNGAGLSGGQRQSVALALALVSTQSLLLLDEPTLGLDRMTQERMLEHFAQLRSPERVVVVATHAAEVIHRCDRVVVLDSGKVVADGPPQRVLAPAAGVGRPSSLAGAAS